MKSAFPQKKTEGGYLDMSSPVALERFRKAAEAFTRRITKTPEAARAQLVSEGSSLEAVGLPSVIDNLASPHVGIRPRLSRL